MFVLANLLLHALKSSGAVPICEPLRLCVFSTLAPSLTLTASCFRSLDGRHHFLLVRRLGSSLHCESTILTMKRLYRLLET